MYTCIHGIISTLSKLNQHISSNIHQPFMTKSFQIFSFISGQHPTHQSPYSNSTILYHIQTSCLCHTVTQQPFSSSLLVSPASGNYPSTFKFQIKGFRFNTGKIINYLSFYAKSNLTKQSPIQLILLLTILLLPSLTE